jgi:hypothetical protein
MELGLPVRVVGYEPDGSHWEEMTETADTSYGGASFNLKHRIALGQVLLLALPLPKRLRQYNHNDATYRVYTLVRGVTHGPDQARVGVMFLGKYPPRGFEKAPGGRYLLPTDSPENPEPTPVPAAATAAPVANPAPTPTRTTPRPPRPTVTVDPNERRLGVRFDMYVNFTLQEVDEWGVVLREELSVAENISKGGARVLTSLNFAKGEVIVVQEVGGSFTTRAEVKGIGHGKDGVRRLNLKFLDYQTPDRLLRSG